MATEELWESGKLPAFLIYYYGMVLLGYCFLKFLTVRVFLHKDIGYSPVLVITEAQEARESTMIWQSSNIQHELS